MRDVDSGWAWLVAIAAFCTQICVLGFPYSIGLFYAEFLDVFKGSSGATAWISSLNYGMVCGIGPIGSILISKFGCRVSLAAGALISFLSLLISCFANSIFYLIISLGICTGSGFGISYMSAMVVISKFFVKYRTFVMGLTVSGAAVGTFVYPLIIQFLLETYAWRGALMLCGAIHLHVFAAAFLIPNKTPLDSIINSQNRKKASNMEHTLDGKLENSNCAGDETILKEESVHQNIENRFGSSGDIRCYSDDDFPLRTNFNDLTRLDDHIATAELVEDKECSDNIHDFESENSMNQFPNEYSPHLNKECTRTMLNGDFNPEKGFLRSNSSVQKNNRHIKKVFQFDELKSVGRTMASTRRCESIWSYLQFLKNPRYILLSLDNFCFSLGILVTYAHLTTFAYSVGLSKSFGSLLISLSGITGLIGRLSLGALAQCKWVSIPGLYACSNILSGLSIIVCAFWNSLPGMTTCICIFGYFHAGFAVLNSEVTCVVVGVKGLDKAFGIILFSAAIGIILGPPIAGTIYDVTQFYPLSFYFGGGCMVLSGVLMIPVVMTTGKRAEVELC